VNGSPEPLPRSYLYCPGDRPDRLARAHSRGADAVIADLEDAVHPDRKDAARRAVADWLAAAQPRGETRVRVNPDTPHALAADVAATMTAGVRGAVLPKAEPAAVTALAGLLADRERALGRPTGSFAVIAVIETARGLLAAPELAAAPRVLRMGFGLADLAAELGAAADLEVLRPLLLQVVVASAAAGIAPPVGPASVMIDDAEGLRDSTADLRRLGFRARSAIHPGQVPVINDEFTPTEAEVTRARAIVAAAEAAAERGEGVATDSDGRMLDVAVVRSSRAVLQQAARHSGPGGRAG
jgi:citrate lyase subunit beta / citryl-CoA lyase